MSKTKSTLTGGAAVIAITVPFLMGWEGMDPVAKRDMIGTGHPITYCNGLTSVDGDVKVGQRFTKEECEKRLALALPKYLDALNKHIKAPMPKKSAASLLDASFNAGSAAVGRSPMLANINAGRIRAGCGAFEGWYNTTKNNGIRKQVRGLTCRRSGCDSRKSERDLCLEGLSEPKAEWYVANAPVGFVEAMPPLIDYKPSAAPTSDPYACFGAGRYDAMRDGRICDAPKRPWWRPTWIFK